LLAGHDTTVTVMGGSVATLLRNPEQLALLRSDLDQLPAALEELIRLNTPGDGSFIRIATTDVSLSDVLIPAGSAVIAPISAGDRDGSVFAEPDTCELFRKDNPHIGFGYGTHFCIGSILARAELEIGLRGLIGRFPGLRLAVRLEELQWKQFAALGGWESFPVAWD
jgi:nocardicin N-oxygenase